MHVGIRTVAVAAVCGLCVGAGVDARAVRPNLSIAGTPTTRSVSSQAVSLASFSDLLAAAAPQNDAAAQMNSVGGGAVSSTDLIGTVAKLLATPNITQSGVTPGINTAAVGTVDPPSSEPVDPPTGQPTDPPAADEPAPPTNFPGVICNRCQGVYDCHRRDLSGRQGPLFTWLSVVVLLVVTAVYQLA
ncbi:hypothetical protein QRK83_17750, partial [Mycobacteroides abscessus]|nr:hypothetical protein [Mycobacteroides abscessus]